MAHKEKTFDFNSIKLNPGKTIESILEHDAPFEYLEPSEYTILPESQWKKQASGLIFCGYRNKSIRKKGVRANTEHLSRVHKQPHRIYYIQ